jgi:hypothetical protein
VPRRYEGADTQPNILPGGPSALPQSFRKRFIRLCFIFPSFSTSNRCYDVRVPMVSEADFFRLTHYQHEYWDPLRTRHGECSEAAARYDERISAPSAEFRACRL